MNNKRKHSLIIGNKVFTGMTAREVDKLKKIMQPHTGESNSRTISLEDYIKTFNPSVRRWISKKGTRMITVEILHNIIERQEDEMSFPEDGAYRNSFCLK